MKVISVAEARAQLSAHIDEVEHTREVVTITRNGKPAAVLVAADEWESVMETLYWSEPGRDAELEAAIEESRHGQNYLLKKLFPNSYHVSVRKNENDILGDSDVTDNEKAKYSASR